MQRALEEFVLALRGSGLEPGLSECVDAYRAARIVGLDDRDRLREAGVAVDYFPGAGLVHGCLRARRVAEVDALRGALIAALRRSLSR